MQIIQRTDGRLDLGLWRTDGLGAREYGLDARTAIAVAGVLRTAAAGWLPRGQGEEGQRRKRATEDMPKVEKRVQQNHHYAVET